MIFSFKKNCTSRFAIAGLLTIALTGCGGGGSEGSNALGNTNSSAATVLPSSTPAAVISSAPASSSVPSSSSAIPVATSSSAPSSTPVQATKSSSPAQSSYARSSRANSSLAEIDDDIPLPPPQDDYQFDQPPTTPQSFRLIAVSSNTALLAWSSSIDDADLSYYEVRRDGSLIGTVSFNSLQFEDSGLKSNTYYTYTIRAIDAAGNRSNFSNAVIAKTLLISQTSSSSSSSHYSATSKSASTSSATHSTTSHPSSAASSAVEQSDSSRNSEQSNSSTASPKTVRIEWVPPYQRENGEDLQINEIGGYEIRYKPSNSNLYVNEVISVGNITSLEIDTIEIGSTILIAAFDTNGLYSRFIELTPK